MSEPTVRQYNHQKFMLNKNIKQLKEFAASLQECEDRWFFEKIWDVSSKGCGLLKEQFAFSASLAKDFIRLDAKTPILSDQEGDFKKVYEGFESGCKDSYSHNNHYVLWVVGGMASTVFSLSVPPIAYCWYATWDNPLKFDHSTPAAILASSATIATLSVGLGSIGYGLYTKNTCNMGYYSEIRETFLKYMEVVKPYEYEVDYSSLDCIDGYCYKNDCELIPLQINNSTLVNAYGYACENEVCYDNGCDLAMIEANNSTLVQ